MACLSIYNLICSLEIVSARRQARPSLSSSHTVWTDSVNIVCVMYKAEAGIIGDFAGGGQVSMHEKDLLNQNLQN